MSTKKIVLKRTDPKKALNFGEVAPEEDFVPSCTYNIFDQYLSVPNTIKVDYIFDNFNIKLLIDNLNIYKKFIEEQYKLVKPFNFFAIIRSPEIREVVLEQLLTLPNFFKERDIKQNPVTRLGNLGNIVFYYCPVHNDLRKVVVDFGVKHNKDIIAPNSKHDGLAYKFEFKREINKRHTLSYDDLDSIPTEKTTKKKFEEKTTEIIKDKSQGLQLGISSRGIGEVSKEELDKIPASVPIIALSKDERDKIGTGGCVNIPIWKMPVRCVSNDKEKHDELLAAFKKIESKSNSETPKEEEDICDLTSNLRKELKKIEENSVKIEQSSGELKETHYNQISKKEEPILPKETINTGKIPGLIGSSTPVLECDLNTKERCFKNVGKSGWGASHELPKLFMESNKGFYERDEKEKDILANKSDDFILNYKFEKMIEHENKYYKGKVYSKFDLNYLKTYRHTYVKHGLLHENGIPFVLVNSNKDIEFSYLTSRCEDNKVLNTHTFDSLYDLIGELKELSKNNLIFIEKISSEKYNSELYPLCKQKNEYKVNMFTISKNKV
jgi:hypothetical protein